MNILLGPPTIISLGSSATKLFPSYSQLLLNIPDREDDTECDRLKDEQKYPLKPTSPCLVIGSILTFYLGIKRVHHVIRRIIAWVFNSVVLQIEILHVFRHFLR